MKKLFAFVSTLILLGSSFAQAATTPHSVAAEQSRVNFEVGSTLHLVHGEAQQMRGDVQFDPETLILEVPATFHIPVSGMITHNKDRDKEMRQMFQSETYPDIVWTATQLECAEADESGWIPCETQGTLKIRNIEQPTDFNLFIHVEEDGVRVKGDWAFERKIFDLNPPSVLGLIRVFQEIKLSFETVWQPQRAE